MTSPHADALATLCRQFADQLPTRLFAIRAHFHGLDPIAWQPPAAEVLHRLVHGLAGSAGTFGMHPLSDAARALERRLAAMLKAWQPPTGTEWQVIRADLDRLEQLAHIQLESSAPSLKPPPAPTGMESRLYEREHLALDHHAIVSITDRAGQITYANDRFCEISGYSLDELLGQNHRIVKSSRHPPEFYRKLWHTIAGGEVWHGKICNRRKDGSLYWVEATITPFLDGDGKPYQYVSIRTDITQMQEAEEKLHRSNVVLEAVNRAQSQFINKEPPAVIFKGLLKSILDLTGSEYGFIGEALHSDDGRPYIKTHGISNIAWNEETRRFDEESAPQGLAFHQIDNLFGWAVTQGTLIISNDPANDPRRGGLPKGHPAFNCVMGIPFFLGGKVMGLIAIANRPAGYDETLLLLLDPLLQASRNIIGSLRLEKQRHEAETALAESESRLNFLVSSSPVCIYTCEAAPPFSVTYISPNIRQLMGYETRQFTENPSFWIENMHPEDRQGVFDKLSQLSEHGIQRHEYRFRIHDGSYRWMHDEMRLVHGESGEPIEIIGYWAGITERMEAEQALVNAQKIAHLGSFDWNPVSGELHWTDEHYRLWGLKRWKCALSSTSA